VHYAVAAALKAVGIGDEESLTHDQRGEAPARFIPPSYRLAARRTRIGTEELAL
jgi:hypothetical protein